MCLLSSNWVDCCGKLGRYIGYIGLLLLRDKRPAYFQTPVSLPDNPSIPKHKNTTLLVGRSTNKQNQALNQDRRRNKTALSRYARDEGRRPPTRRRQGNKQANSPLLHHCHYCIIISAFYFHTPSYSPRLAVSEPSYVLLKNPPPVRLSYHHPSLSPLSSSSLRRHPVAPTAPPHLHLPSADHTSSLVRLVFFLD